MSQEAPPLETDDELDPELSGTPPGDVDTGTPPADDDGEPPVDPNWKSLQEKYPGLSDDEIRTKVYGSYWEQTRALSATEKEKRDLELENARLRGQVEGAGPPPDAEPPAPPPEIQELDHYIHGLEEQDQEVAEDQTKALKAISDAKDAVGEVKGQIKAIKEGDFPDADARIATLNVELRGAERDVVAARRDLDQTVRARKQLTRERGQALGQRSAMLKAIQENQARQEQEQQDLEEALDEIPDIVDGHIAAHIENEKVGVPKDADLREHLRDHLRDKVTIDLWKAGGSVPFNKIDVPTLVKQHTEKYMKAHGLAKRATFGETSERKTRAAGGQPPAKPTTPPPGAPPKKTVVSGAGALSPGMLRGRRLLEKKGW